ncbi:hypothetical protein JOF53_001268 [Crossiella equi]|uniref:Uncharacterized protein n=1 Tax=Crossiella equi TaxID=130796 RepID=A0ABS5A717_9PSEU|nr:hypothetical protein [Crossiella equi]MBP2472396.1 hypothetical protein [Crossiella equi]
MDTVQVQLLRDTTARDVLARWRAVPWPPGLRTITCHTAGDAVLTWTRWETEAPLLPMGASGAPRRYRVHQSGGEPESIVVSTFSAADHESARRWADALLARWTGEVLLGADVPGVLLVSAGEGLRHALHALGVPGPPGAVNGGFRRYGALTRGGSGRAGG